MTNYLVDHIRLGCVERRRVMAYVLGAEEHTIGQRFEEYTWFNQAGDRLKPKSADGANLLAYLTELGYAIRIKL